MRPQTGHKKTTKRPQKCALETVHGAWPRVSCPLRPSVSAATTLLGKVCLYLQHERCRGSEIPAGCSPSNEQTLIAVTWTKTILKVQSAELLNHSYQQRLLATMSMSSVSLPRFRDCRAAYQEQQQARGNFGQVHPAALQLPLGTGEIANHRGSCGDTRWKHLEYTKGTNWV